MKIVKSISFYASIVLMMLFAFVFGVVECRTMLSGDWMLYQNVGAEFVGYLFRFLFFASMIGFGVFLIVVHIKHIKLSVIWTYIFVAFVLGSFFTFFFYEWYIGLIICLGNNFLLGSSIFELTRK